MSTEHTETIAGLVERVTFHNPDNGFAVLRVKARGHRDLVTVIGSAAMISAGEWITASGVWVNDRTHGLQLRARWLKTAAPTSREGIERYLASGMIRGIGPHFAKRLVGAFGETVFDVIEAAPERLREISGVGPVRQARIVAGWAEQKAVREIMLFLHQHGVGTARAVRIYKTYGDKAVEIMTTDPYRLAKDIRGIGFRSADAIAMRLGIQKTDAARLRAGVSYALAEAMGEGHCGLPLDQLGPTAAKLLEVAPDLIPPAIDAEIQAETVILDAARGRDCAFLAGLHWAETEVAERLSTLAHGAPPWPDIGPERAIPWAEARIGVTLADSQRAAIRAAVRTKLLVITGGPGVGKTTLVNAILRILAAKGVRILLAAPTGRAAKRLSEATSREAKTLHRLLAFDPKRGAFTHDADAPLDCDLLVVDETSMVDVLLMRGLLRAVPDSAALLIVGDVDQLPSVGPGQVLADMIASGVIETVRLTEVFRQAAASRIIQNAHRINAGRTPDLRRPDGESDFYFVAAETPEAAVERIVSVMRDRIPARFGLDPIRDVQALCPMTRGAVGSRSLNATLQAALNPEAGPRIERFGYAYAPGDKVMQLENDYDRGVYNGDLGFVTGVDLEEGVLTVEFEGRKIAYEFGELDALTLAYAATIHKSQGSEYPAVVIPVLTQHYAMLQRNLLYTGVTRGKKLVVLVGQPKAVAMATRTVKGRSRWSRLADLLSVEA